MSFEQSYYGRLRCIVGDMPIIVPSARAVIIDGKKKVLLIKRKDNARLALPAGAIEVGESLYQCLEREVREETGLSIISAIPVALYSEPRFYFENAYGNKHCSFAVAFRIDSWQGRLLRTSDETVDAGFFHRDKMPALCFGYEEVVFDALEFNGEFIVK